MDPKENISQPGHLTFLTSVCIFLAIIGFAVYFVLTLPLFYFVILALVAFWAKKFLFEEELDEQAIFIREHEKAKVCIVGTGFSGLCMAVKLKKAGIKFRVLEKSSQVGGTWHANRYPGCRCDVWSVIYQV